jgi:hypothetical protein
MFRWIMCSLALTLCCFLEASPTLYLRDNLQRAQKGDYIVMVQNKNYLLFHIQDRNDKTMAIEEITAPISKLQRNVRSWRNWVAQRAPGNTSWVVYSLDLQSGKILEFYSVSKDSWYDTSQTDSFLTTLLNLRLELIPWKDRKRVGLLVLPGMTDKRPFWQPRMVVNGQEIRGVTFNAWITTWPKDGTDLAGKTLEAYTPQENDLYPSYFPYWLQISGMIGNAKIRIIDSGKDMTSPTFPLEAYKHPSYHR